MLQAFQKLPPHASGLIVMRAISFFNRRFRDECIAAHILPCKSAGDFKAEYENPSETQRVAAF
ncbi:hypothetical protein CM15mP35_03130 [bacterium]|nr:MAG: hypothetical protein CM15mP35_03130 [bacterium]